MTGAVGNDEHFHRQHADIVKSVGDARGNAMSFRGTAGVTVAGTREIFKM